MFSRKSCCLAAGPFPNLIYLFDRRNFQLWTRLLSACVGQIMTIICGSAGASRMIDAASDAGIRPIMCRSTKAAKPLPDTSAQDVRMGLLR